MMKHFLMNLMAAALLLILVSACESEPRTPRSIGITSEILVVTQTNAQWDGKIGDAIRAYFGQAQYGLPQEEPIYKVAHIQVGSLSEMFKKHRNILLVEVVASQKEALVETRTDLWSKPQRVIKIQTSSDSLWVATFNEHAESLKLLYDRTERERLLNIFGPTAKLDIVNAIKEQMGVSMVVPEGFMVAKKASGFMWLRRETPENGMGILIWTMPYSDTLQLSDNRLIFTRDSIVSLYVPGPSPGSFMTTDKEFITPHISRVSYFVNDFAVENRGVWKLVGDFMAGPYLSYTVIDQKHGRLLTVEGYVYAPNKDKRDLLRQLEAILFSLNLNP